MLLWFMDLLLREPLSFFFLMAAILIALLVAITVHEFSHALMADRLGDNTPRRLGRLSLNPRAHLDPVGTLMLFVAGFGWGKPVPVNPYYLRREPKSALALVSSAGPLSNLVTAAVFALPFRLGALEWHSPLAAAFAPYLGVQWFFTGVLGSIIFYNIILALFNLIPVAPLDGFKVAVGLLPRGLSYSLARTERYGPMILILILLFGFYTGLLWDILRPAMDLLSFLLLGRSFWSGL